MIFRAACLSILAFSSFSYGEEEVLAEGKTKIVLSYPDDPSLAIFEAKDDITAGDGAKHDILEKKAELATKTTCNVFRLLKSSGIPVAFQKQLDERRFLADFCEMILYEVVVRREAHGSYLKRYPYLEKGYPFPKLIVEFFLKTSGKEWQGMTIPKDDPLVQFNGERADLYLPDTPIQGQKPFMSLDDFPLKNQSNLMEEMALIAKESFLILEKAWQLQGGRLVDYKVEFGINSSGKLLLADVIDNDSWRVIQNQQYIDKQVYRDGGALDKVLVLYRHVSEVTSQFKQPLQQIILWRAPDDDLNLFLHTIEPYANEFLKIVEVTSSVHKNPISSYQTLQELIQQIPDSVLISYICKSNGADPTLAANATIPVITTPLVWENFEKDVWPSLHIPSSASAMIVLEPSNAALAALQILAMRNPLLYMQLRLKQEERLVNIFNIDES